MQNNDLAIVRDFQHRYQKLSQTSGYNLVYDTMALIQDIIPCAWLNFTIFSPKNLNLGNVELGTVPLWVAVPSLATFQSFFSVFSTRLISPDVLPHKYWVTPCRINLYKPTP